MNRVFELLPEAARERLFARGTRRTYAAGQVILSEGDPADRVFVLESGAVRVFHASPEGVEVLLKVFRAPAIFGEAESMAGLPYVENVCAQSVCEIDELPIDAVLEAMRSDGASATAFLVDVATRLAITAQHEKSLAFDPMTVRLANYLVDYVSWTHPDGDATPPRLAMTQDEMGAAIGATRRSIGKDITTWQKDGVLERVGDHYLVRDLAALKRYATPDRPHLHYSLERRKRSR